VLVVTTLISAVGLVGRFAGDLLIAAFGWAASIMFGRVPRSHQIYLSSMVFGSVLWAALLVLLVVPSLAVLALSTTPHPGFLNPSRLATAMLVGVVVLPALVGLAGWLVPVESGRARGLGAVREILRGYITTPAISGLLVFLAGVGLTRKLRSRRHGWADTHVPVVIEAGDYDPTVATIRASLVAAGFAADARPAPRILSLPAWVLTRIGGPNSSRKRPDRLYEIYGSDLRVGVYPSDIAISIAPGDRMEARATVFDALETTKAHLTTSAEAQKVEDELKRIAKGGSVGYQPGAETFGRVDAAMKDLDIPESEWDILYRIRMQVEANLLRPTTAPGFVGSVGVQPAALGGASIGPADVPALAAR
jgi:hypothetical protein